MHLFTKNIIRKSAVLVPRAVTHHILHQLSAVARLRHSVLLETRTRSHLSYAREHTVWLAVPPIKPNASVSAVGRVHHHPRPSSELLCAQGTSVWCSQANESKTTLVSLQVSFQKRVFGCLPCIPPALDRCLNTFSHHSRACVHALWMWGGKDSKNFKCLGTKDNPFTIFFTLVLDRHVKHSDLQDAPLHLPRCFT